MRELQMTYVFSPGVGGAGSVQLPTFGGDIEQEKLLGIWNARRGLLVYSPHVDGYGGVVAGNAIALDADTSAMSSGDKLVVFYEGTWEADILAEAVSIRAAAEATQAAVQAINTKTPALVGGKVPVTDPTALPLPSGAATAASQAALNTLMSDILAELRDDVFLTQMLWEDPSTSDPKEFYREERVVSQDDQSVTTIYTRLRDNTVVGSLPGGCVPVEVSDVRDTQHLRWLVVNNGVDYTKDDWLVQTIIVDTTGSGSVQNVFWYNVTQGVGIGTPLSADIVQAEVEVLDAIKTLIELSNTHLATLISNLGVRLVGAGTAAGAGRMTLASDDPLVVLAGVKTTSVTALETGGVGIIGWLSQIWRDLKSGIVLAAGTNTIGKFFSAFQSTKALTNVSVNAAASGENTLVGGTASQTIRVFAGSFTAASAVTLTFKDAASGNTLAIVPLAAGGCFSFDTMASGEPLWVSASSGAFILSLSSAVQVYGFVQYVKS